MTKFHENPTICEDGALSVRRTTRRNVFVISGPAGSGKDSVVAYMRSQCPAIRKTVSVTTRVPRDGERDGESYRFVSPQTFSQYVEDGLFAEWVQYNRHSYGTLYSEIDERAEDEPIVLVLDVRGRRSIAAAYPLAKSIFIAPPSMEELENRLVARGQNTAIEICERLAIAQEEMKVQDEYDLTVVNRNIEETAQQILEYMYSVCESGEAAEPS